jgi:glycosyltransferase involved in cell wall biosynthesis
VSDSARPVVLIDARGLRDDATSNHTYWRELTAALVRLDSGFRFVLASNVPVPSDHLQGSNWDLNVGGPSNNRVWSLWHLPKLSRDVAASLVHVQYTVSPFFRCPVVTTVHDVSFFINPEWLPSRDAQILRFTVPRACKKSKAVIVVSRSVKRDLLKFIPVDANKVFVTPLGAPPLDPLAGSEPVGDYYLLVGGFSPRKNWRLALEAVDLARQRSSKELRLVITGSRRDDADLPDWVSLPGPVPREELDRLYRGAIALIHPALYEGFGLTPLEAWSHGTPAIVSSIDPLLESCGPAKACVDGWEASAWADAALEMLNPLARAERGMLGRVQTATYSWHETAIETMKAYEMVLG